MKQSTKNFIGDVAKAVCAIGIVALCRRFGVKTSFTIGDAVRSEDEPSKPYRGIGVKWPEARSPLQRKLLRIAQSGLNLSTDSSRYDAAYTIWQSARIDGDSQSDKEFAAELLRIFAERAVTDSTRMKIINGITTL